VQYRFAARARADLRDIGAYTLATWGAAQCDRYLDEIRACCQSRADDPTRGRACDHIRPALFRKETGRHVVFYRLRQYGVRVVAILYDRMLPELHLTGRKGDDD
jgi:toxin ParE1/3/4